MDICCLAFILFFSCSHSDLCQKVSDIRRSNSDAAGLETEIVMLQTEKARLIQQLDGQVRDVCLCMADVTDKKSFVRSERGDDCPSRQSVGLVQQSEDARRRLEFTQGGPGGGKG